MTRHMTEAIAWQLMQKAAAAGAAALSMDVRGYIDRSRRLYGQIRMLRESTDRTLG